MCVCACVFACMRVCMRVHMCVWGGGTGELYPLGIILPSKISLNDETALGHQLHSTIYWSLNIFENLDLPQLNMFYRKVAV